MSQRCSQYVIARQHNSSKGNNSAYDDLLGRRDTGATGVRRRSVLTIAIHSALCRAQREGIMLLEILTNIKNKLRAIKKLYVNFNKMSNNILNH